jgi:uncharacterized membrane protein YbhN (UPF0104 family)
MSANPSSAPPILGQTDTTPEDPSHAGQDVDLVVPTAAVEAGPAPSLGGSGHRGGKIARIGGPIAFVASLIAAGAVLWHQGALDDVGPAIRGASVPTIIAGLLLYLVGLALLCLRWHLLVRMTKGASDFARATEAFLISVTLNYVTPVSLAIPMRAALTKKALGLDATETGAVVLWEVMADVAVLAAAGGIWLLASGGAYGDVLDAAGGGLLVIGGLLLLGLAVLGGVFLYVRRKPALRAKLLAAANRALRYPRQRPRDARGALAVTVVYWVVQAGVFWILLEALDGEVSVGLLLGVVSLPILFGMLSPWPGGAGVREALMIAVAGVYGAAAAPVLVAAVAYRIALFASIPILYAAARIWIAVRGNHSAAGMSIEA